jgi:hypothetical protein
MKNKRLISDKRNLTRQRHLQDLKRSGNSRILEVKLVAIVQTRSSFLIVWSDSRELRNEGELAFGSDAIQTLIWSGRLPRPYPSREPELSTKNPSRTAEHLRSRRHFSRAGRHLQLSVLFWRTRDTLNPLRSTHCGSARLARICFRVFHHGDASSSPQDRFSPLPRITRARRS